MIYRSLDSLLAAVDAGHEAPFRVIYADPPWTYRNRGSRGAACKQYDLMPQADLAALPIARLATPDAVLFMWATVPLMPECLAVLQGWGFTYRDSLVWVKTGAMGLGNYARICHELLLVGVRGEPALDMGTTGSVVWHRRGRHSAKPDVFRDLIRAACPGPYVELFARESMPGWSCMGNQVRPGNTTLFAEGIA